MYFDKSRLTLWSLKQNILNIERIFYSLRFKKNRMCNQFLWTALQMPKYRMIGPLPYLYIFWYIGGRGWIRNFLWTLNCPLNWMISKSTDICKLWIFFFSLFILATTWETCLLQICLPCKGCIGGLAQWSCPHQIWFGCRVFSTSCTISVYVIEVK